MKLKYKIIAILITFSLLSCFKFFKKDEESLNYEKANKNDKQETELKKLPVNYNKLENYLGAAFIPVFSMKANFDNDIDDEVCIAYKQNNSSNIKVVIFDILPKNMIKLKFEFKTNIFDKDSFIFQFQNFFDQKDLTILLEGKTEDKKSLLYIYTLDNGEYKLIKDFSADYSVIIDYTDIENDSAKYSKVKDIVTVNNYVGVTSTNVQQKNVYIWEKDKNDFKLIETSKVVYSSNIIDSSIYSSEDSFFNYLKGIWYLDRYEYLINSNQQVGSINTNNIEFVQISSSPKEVSVKNEDYVNKYPATKVFRVWNGNIPGIRIISYGMNQNKTTRQKDIELYLMEPNRLKIIGPNKFDEKDYIRLSKPLIEYINDLKENKIKNDVNQINAFLIKDFKSDDNTYISFTGNNAFVLKKDSIEEKGVYKLTYDKSGYLITFLFENKSSILKYNNYFIKTSKEKDYFSILPVKIKIDKVMVDDFKEIVFYRNGATKG